MWKKGRGTTEMVTACNEPTGSPACEQLSLCGECFPVPAQIDFSHLPVEDPVSRIPSRIPLATPRDAKEIAEAAQQCYEGVARRPSDSATLPRGRSMVQICVPCVVMHEAMS
jgi:hypothetical protein